MGRFMSPDWSAKVEPVPYSKLDDPQSLNLYAYVRNNPLGNVDADGHDYGQLEAKLAGSGSAGVAYSSQQEQQQIEAATQQSYEATEELMDKGLLMGVWAQKQQDLAKTAISEIGDKTYGKSAPPCGWKCSKFVGDMLNAVGLPVHQGYKSNPDGPPVAGDWANPKVTIKGWTLLPLGSKPQAGDVAAYRENYSDATGHAGIVGYVNKQAVYTVAAGNDHVYGTYNFGDGETVRYRRYTGEE